MCCPPPIFKPSLGRREKLAEKVGGREIYPPVPPPLSVDNKRITGARPKITKPVVLREEEEEEEGEVRTKERKIACEKLW